MTDGYIAFGVHAKQRCLTVSLSISYLEVAMKIPNNLEILENENLFSPLYPLGWSSFFQEQLISSDGEQSPARVVGVRKNCYLVSQGNEDVLATVAGKFFNEMNPCLPVVGDWVLLRESVVTSVLPRKNALSRKASGGRNRKNGEAVVDDQVIAANLDTVFIVCGLDRDFNLRRIERYITMVYNCGIVPVVVLTKADLHQSPDRFVLEVERVAFGISVFLISAKENEEISRLKSFLASGQTTALVGSSGAGKSTLINRLYGEEIQATGAVSKSIGKGRHTTTSRDLIVLPSGGMLIDNPGIREIGLGLGCANTESAFPDIDELSLFCKFPDCSHTHEPGCQVQEAVSSGKIDQARLKSYQKIKNEQIYLFNKETKGAARAERERWKGVAQKVKAIKKRRK